MLGIYEAASLPKRAIQVQILSFDFINNMSLISLPVSILNIYRFFFFCVCFGEELGGLVGLMFSK